MNGNTAVIVVMGIFLVLGIGQQVVALSKRTTRAKTVRQLPREFTLRCGAIVVMPLAVYFQPKHVPLVFVIFGACVILPGLILSLWAQAVMGRFWIPGIGTHKGHKLVTSGPFGYIRHPIYTGAGLMAIGSAIFSMNIFMLGVNGLLWLSMAIRVPYEEKLMHQKFKKRWEHYVESTGLFMPRFRR